MQLIGDDGNNTPPAQFQAFVQGEAKHWAEAVRLSGAQID